MDFLLTTDPGLEDVAAAELSELRPDAEVAPAPAGCRGRVRARLDGLDDLLRLRTVHHVLELLGEAEVGSLDDIERTVAGTEIPALVQAATFRVTTERRGEHAFGTIDIQRRAGAALHRRYGTKVDLEQPEVEVRVDLDGARLFCGIQRTTTSLGKRIRRAAPLRSALKPTVAAAMLRLAGAQRGAGRLLDPLCGSGTIPLEAWRLNPALAVHASDWDPRTVDNARRTLEAHGVPVEVREADARSLATVYAEPFDFIVTDPPYGVRQGRRTSLSRLYTALLESFAERLAPEGKLALIVLKYGSFRSALERTALRITHERPVELGAIRPSIVVLER